MCSACDSAVCHPACPYRQGGYSPAVCERCGEPVSGEEGGYACGGRYLCIDCADNITVDELILLLDLPDAVELLALLGFRRLG